MRQNYNTWCSNNIYLPPPQDIPCIYLEFSYVLWPCSITNTFHICIYKSVPTTPFYCYTNIIYALYINVVDVCPFNVCWYIRCNSHAYVHTLYELNMKHKQTFICIIYFNINGNEWNGIINMFILDATPQNASTQNTSIAVYCIGILCVIIIMFCIEF